MHRYKEEEMPVNRERILLNVPESSSHKENAFSSTYQDTKGKPSLLHTKYPFLEGVGGSSHRGNAFSSTYQKYSRWRKEGVGVSSHRVNVFYST